MRSLEATHSCGGSLARRYRVQGSSLLQTQFAALWRSARNGHRRWFIALFVLNTAGILPIVYLKFFRRQK